VLLIDAGGDSGDALVETVPVLFPFSTEFADTEWDFFVTRSSDPAIQAQDSITSYRLPDGTVYTGLDPPADAVAIGTLYPRAGTLGGCSRHNALIAIRAFDNDWTVVADKTGDTSWSGATFQRLFENIEHCDYLPNSIVGHGFDGWFWTEVTSLLTAVQDLKVVSIIVAAGAALGKG
jgi:choline dehydrogenase